MGFVGRLLDDKGVRTLVDAHAILAQRGRPVRLLIAGDPDPANPVSIPPQEIAAWSRRPGLLLLGHVADIRDVWKAAHIAVLPSRREGLPKSLLEAAACGRPIVATDVPGCREIARAGVNALLVPPDDPVALADAIDTLAQDAAMRARFGAAGRQTGRKRILGGAGRGRDREALRPAHRPPSVGLTCDCTMPARNPTVTIMANADRIGDRARGRLGWTGAR